MYWRNLLVLLIACTLLSPGVNIADTVAPPVTFTATTGAGYFIFENNPGGTFAGPGGNPAPSSATFEYGNLDSTVPQRTVWKAVITRNTTVNGPYAGVFLILNCLNISSLPDPEELVFDVRRPAGSATADFWIKMESWLDVCDGAACNAQVKASTRFTVSSSYQEVRIPMNVFLPPAGCNVNESKMRTWVIVWDAQSSNTTGTLTLFFDNMRFE